MAGVRLSFPVNYNSVNRFIPPVIQTPLNGLTIEAVFENKSQYLGRQQIVAGLIFFKALADDGGRNIVERRLCQKDFARWPLVQRGYRIGEVLRQPCLLFRGFHRQRVARALRYQQVAQRQKFFPAVPAVQAE